MQELTKKEKEFLKELFGKNADFVLCAMDSSYAEGNEDEFSDLHKIKFTQARIIINKFLKQL
jgi:hypothetical protein